MLRLLPNLRALQIKHYRSIMLGTYGTYSIYDLDYEPPQLVGFRAQFSRLGSNDVARWKSYSQEVYQRRCSGRAGTCPG